MNNDLLRQADSIWPLLQKKVEAMIAAAGRGVGSSGAVGEHEIGGSLHKGVLRDDQGPQFLLRDGTRPLTNSMDVDAGVTIDGVDISAHAANPDAHHARAHVLATAAGLGADHSMSGAAAGQVLRANSATNAMWAYLSHTDLSGVTADQHHAKQHDIVDAANHTVSGAAWNVVGATALNTLGLMLARSDATGTPKETLLKSDASGYLNLVRLIASDRLRTSLLDTPAGQHLTMQPAVDLLLDPGSKLVKAQTDVALQASNFASQVTGWRITHDGQIDARYLFVDEMHAKAFTVDLEQALAGGQIISKSVAMLATTFTAPGGGTNTITLRAVSTGTAAAQSSVAANKPTGTVSGDVMLGKVANWTGRTVTPPSGWTLLTTQTGGSYTQVFIYYRVAGTTPYTPATEPASYTWTLSGTDDAHLEIQTWYNVDTANPIDVYGGQGGTTTTSVTAPSITTTTTNTRLVFFAGFSDSNNTGATATPAAGWTEHTDGVAGSYAWGYSMSKAQAAAGATGTVTATLATGHQYAAVVLALRASGNPVTTLTVRDLPSAPGMAVFQAGDIVRVRQFSRSAGSLSIADCWGAVSGYVDNGDKTQTWTFTRSSAPNAGSMAAGTVIQPDAITLDYGTDGNGYYEVNAIDGANAVNSPYLQFVRWTGHPATGQAVRTRLGQLRGIFGQDEFGLFAGTGTANTDRYVRVSDYAAGNGINNLPFSLRNAGVEVVRLGGWNDVWVGPSSADRRINWDGTTLTVKGSIVVTGGSGIGAFTDAGALATVNNLDGVPEGTTYKRTTVNEKTGAGRAYSAIDAANALVTKVVPGSNIGTPAGSGLYLGADYLGYYNSAGAAGKKWTVFIDNTGKFGLGGTAGARLGWDGTDLFGTDGTTVQWYARATDGRWYAAAGKLMASAQGISILSETAEPNGGGPTSIAWAKTLPNTNVTGEVYSWDSGAFNELTAVARNIGVTKGVRARIGTSIDYTLSSGMRFSSTYTGGVWTHSYDVYGLGSFWNDVAMYGNFSPSVIWSRGRTASTTRWNIIPEIDAAGVMEIGRYVDYHIANADAGDYSIRTFATDLYTLGINTPYGGLEIGPRNGTYNHFVTDRLYHWFNTSVSVNGFLSSYQQDLDLRRDGTQRIVGYTWGTYVTAHLTMEDVFAMLNVQGSEPIAPTTGAKLYLFNEGGIIKLKIVFANGVRKALAGNN